MGCVQKNGAMLLQSYVLYLNKSVAYHIYAGTHEPLQTLTIWITRKHNQKTSVQKHGPQKGCLYKTIGHGKPSTLMPANCQNLLLQTPPKEKKARILLTSNNL